MKSIYDQRKTFYIGNTMLDIYYDFDDFGPDHNPFLVYFNSFYGNGPAKSSMGESFVLKHNIKSGEYADTVLLMIRKQFIDADELLYAGAIDMWFAEGYCDEDPWILDIYNWARSVFDEAFLMKSKKDISDFEKRLGINHKAFPLPWEKTDEISCDLYVRLKATPSQIHELLCRNRERRHKMLKQLVEEGSFKLDGDSRISGEAIRQYNLEHPQRQYDEYEDIEYTY